MLVSEKATALRSEHYKMSDRSELALWYNAYEPEKLPREFEPKFLHKKNPVSKPGTFLIGGRWEVRTPDPLGVNEMLFQLS